MTTAGRKISRAVLFIAVALSTILIATRFAATGHMKNGRQLDAKAAGHTSTGAKQVHAPTPHQNGPGRHDDAAPEEDSKRTIVLHGKVLGPGNRGVSGARLYLSVDESTDPAELGTSHPDGSYRFVVSNEVLRRTLWPNFVSGEECKAALIAVARGLGPGWAELPSEDGGRMGNMKADYARDIHLVADFPIAGRVVSNDGKPVAGATIAIDGMFELADPRWTKMHAAIKAGDPTLVNRPLSDPNNWFTPLYPNAWKMLPPATTDSGGRFQVVGVGGDRAIRLAVTGAGLRTASVSVLTRSDVADFTGAIRTRYPRTSQLEKNESERDQGVRLFGPSPTIDVDPARTVAGVVRDARTGKPIIGHRMTIASGSGYATATTDRDGRYRILRREDDETILIYSDQFKSDHYLTVARQLTDANELGEIVANLDIPPGVVINGRVLEAGTERPIVAGRRHHCHDPQEGGPMMAGYVHYFPLSTNSALRGAPTGLYFEGLGRRTNFQRVAVIGADGRFHIAVPPGPGVLFVKADPGQDGLTAMGIWKESTGFHRLFPYAKLTTRAKNDGAPSGDTQNLPGLTGPIPLSRHHAYRVINPAPDAEALDLTLSVPRAPSRIVQFLGPDGGPIRGVKVLGLLAPPMTTSVILDGSKADVHALEPGKPRQLIAMSADGKYIARTIVTTDNPQSTRIRLEPAGSIRGRLLDASTGRPLADFSAWLSYQVNQNDESKLAGWVEQRVNTGADGRFVIDGAVPGLGASVSFQYPVRVGQRMWASNQIYQPNSLRAVMLQAGETRDLGDVRINPSTAAGSHPALSRNAAGWSWNLLQWCGDCIGL